MIHRVVFGSIERFIGILTEHFAGAFPLWLAPVQVQHPDHHGPRGRCAAKDLQAKLEEAGIRTEIDLRNEKIGFKIREAQMQKIPYMLVLGDKEVENGVLSVRSRKGAVETMTYDEVLAKLREEIETKAL